MSQKTIIDVSCPICNASHPYAIWESISTKSNPEMKAAVRDGSAFLYICPDCGKKSYLEYDFKYYEEERDRNIMIYSIDSDENAEEVYKLLTDKKMDIISKLSEHGCLVRIVRSSVQLAEKLAIFDEGLDDRIVEIFKVFVLAKYLENTKEVFEEFDTYFHTGEDGKHYIHMIIDGKAEEPSEMTEEDYRSLWNEYAFRLKEIQNEDPYIDHQWAMKMLGLTDEDDE